ncbi:hypothetical protein Tco_1182278 [Tanacetum coccineum]
MNIKRKSLKESGSFKGKVVTHMKTKKVQSDQCLLTQSQSSHFESISLNRDAEVRSQPSYSNRRQLSVEKSLDWDSAFFTNEDRLKGCVCIESTLLSIFNPLDPFSKYNRKEYDKKKASQKLIPNQESSGTRKGVPSHVQCEGVGSRRLSILRKSVDWDTAFASEGLLIPKELFMDQSSKESDGLHLRTSESDFLIDVKPDIKKLTKQVNLNKSTSLTTETNSKGVLSPSDFLPPPRHPPCRNFKEIKFTSQDVTRSSIRNVMPSGLRMSSPRIGFFDELNFKGSMQRLNEFPSVKGRPSFLHKAYGIVPSTLVQVIYSHNFLKLCDLLTLQSSFKKEVYRLLNPEELFMVKYHFLYKMTSRKLYSISHLLEFDETYYHEFLADSSHYKIVMRLRTSIL